jgi:two-component system response regulator HydG
MYRASRVVVDLDDTSQLLTLEEVERRYILRVLEATGGHRTKAAELLGLDRKTLYRKLERWGVSE